MYVRRLPQLTREAGQSVAGTGVAGREAEGGEDVPERVSETKHAACCRMVGEIKAVCEAATPGPWRKDNLGPLYPGDLEFIARSRSWLPAWIEYAEGVLARHVLLTGVDAGFCDGCDFRHEVCPEVAALHAALSKMVEGTRG